MLFYISVYTTIIHIQIIIFKHIITNVVSANNINALIINNLVDYSAKRKIPFLIMKVSPRSKRSEQLKSLSFKR